MPASLDDYDVICTIGSGSYGTCKKIRRRSDGKVLVWKEIEYGTMSETEKQMLVSEVNLLRELKHKHIVRYYDRIIDRISTKIYIVMEYCEGGDLATLISKCRRENRYLDESMIWKILVQVLQALKECHRRKGGRAVLHRDLKPANVFLDASNNVKLGDFGLARVLHHETSFAKTFVGTPYYMSPEQMNYMSYNEKSDIWSLGCMVYELCSLHPPFTAANQKDLAVRIKIGRFSRIPRQYSDDLSSIVDCMLKVDGDRRPTIDELLDNSLVIPKLPNDQRRAGTGDKESSLRRREKMLDKREKELDSREKSIALKEKLAEEKLSRAEALMRDCKLKNIDSIAYRDTDIEYKILPPCLVHNRKEDSPKKQVTFSFIDQENSEPDLESDTELLAVKNKPSIPKYNVRQDSDVGNGQFDARRNYAHDYLKRLELRDRLKKAKERSKYLRDAEIESRIRSRQLLGMR
ncbi:serine/threonine-protein kinase Nek2 [Lingula anatina]|uniref:Serine/threonine-protein kinase Nek2 n=1 Tax=Lingula anatina TaxID=7574 RepID=A0A1S3IS94_LINAN|nr:serine/threonine-protein kinase Nek2 [Lingula anatina]|eukprot:XP_013400811.1 serine/threonine-protein kinase Nek2 [Lingula anatina]